MYISSSLDDAQVSVCHAEMQIAFFVLACGPVQITRAFYPLKRRTPARNVAPLRLNQRGSAVYPILPEPHPLSFSKVAFPAASSVSRSRFAASLRASSCTGRSPPRRRTIRIPISLPASLSPRGRVRYSSPVRNHVHPRRRKQTMSASSQFLERVTRATSSFSRPRDV